METNIILAGVGGQGILSISYVIDMAALRQGLSFKQSEVHGMSQRGGSVQSHLRISDTPLHSDLVPKGRGTLVLSVEPLESLRYVGFLSPHGTVVTGTDPFVNISDYPAIDTVLDAVAELHHHILVPAERLARQAGSTRAQNIVLFGAASPLLGLKDDLLETGIAEAFARKGEKVQKINLDAFRFGKAAGDSYRACREIGIAPRAASLLVGRSPQGQADPKSLSAWKRLLEGAQGRAVFELLASREPGLVRAGAAAPASAAALSSPSPQELKSVLLA